MGVEGWCCMSCHYIFIDTDCCTRQFCGVMRPFVMNVSDLQGTPLMTLHRPFRCQGSIFWCCCLQEMEIQSPPGVLQGRVKEMWVQPPYIFTDSSFYCPSIHELLTSLTYTLSFITFNQLHWIHNVSSYIIPYNGCPVILSLITFNS